MCQKDKITYKKVLTHVLTFLLGLFAYYCTEKIGEHLNRPILDLKTSSLTIQKDWSGDWEAAVKMEIENRGKSETSITFTELRLSFPEYSSRPFVLQADSSTKVTSMSNTSVEIKAIFPSIFDSLYSNEMPKLKLAEIAYREVDSHTIQFIRQDSTNISYQLYFGPEPNKPEKLKDSIVDTSGNVIGVVTGVFNIQYRGRNYPNRIYPKDAHIDYEIEDDKIYLQYSGSLSPLKMGGQSNLLEPFILIPHPDLREHIVYPRGREFEISVERRGKDRIAYEKYNIAMGSMTKMFVYLFQ